jgi:hypothetical protein
MIMMMTMMIIAMLMKNQNNSDEAPIDTCIEEFFAFTKVFHAWTTGSHLQGGLGFHHIGKMPQFIGGKGGWSGLVGAVRDAHLVSFARGFHF